MQRSRPHHYLSMHTVLILFAILALIMMILFPEAAGALVSP